jgi:DNA-directed RNA polymerase subunit L
MPPKPAAKNGRFRSLRISPEVEGLPDPDGKAPARADFHIVGVPLCVVNALRRALFSDVKTAAIPFDPTGSLQERDAGIKFHVNTSVMHNEMLGHRIALVPLGFDEAQLATFDPAKYKFVLHVKNTGEEAVAVTTADFKVLNEADAAMPQAFRDAVFPPSPVTGDHVLLMRLRPGEELHLEARARLGRGRENARWMPVSRCFFVNHVDPAKFEASLKVKAEKADVNKEEDGDAYEALRGQHAVLDGLRDFVTDEHGEPVEFDFTVITESRLRPALLVRDGFRVLSDKVRRMAAALTPNAAWASYSSADSGGVDEIAVAQLPNMDDMYQLLVRGEDHTLGNLVQGLLYTHWVIDGGSEEVTFIGYHQPHPLEGNIVFKIKCASAGADVRRIFARGLEWVAAQLKDIELEWEGFARI